MAHGESENVARIGIPEGTPDTRDGVVKARALLEAIAVFERKNPRIPVEEGDLPRVTVTQNAIEGAMEQLGAVDQEILLEAFCLGGRPKQDPGMVAERFGASGPDGFEKEVAVSLQRFAEVYDFSRPAV